MTNCPANDKLSPVKASGLILVTRVNFAGGEKQDNNGDNFEAESSFFYKSAVVLKKPKVLQVRRFSKGKEEGIIFCTFQI